jgi:hypothetical protein
VRALAAALLLLAACAEDPLALAPFPCAGDGTCPASLTCADGLGDLGAAVCLPECTSSLDCEEGSRCAPVGETRACLPECTPFGTDCDGASTCRMQPDADEGYTATCLAVTGGGEMFGACESSLDCPGNASCVHASMGEPKTCRPQCDAEHPCRRRMTCEPLLPSGAGVCR